MKPTGSGMGEIRVKVKLTNAADEAMNRARKLSKKKVRTYEADAVVDTGAVRSVIPAHVLEKLGVGTRGTRVAGYADGRTEAVGISGGIIFDVMGRDTIEEAIAATRCVATIDRRACRLAFEQRFSARRMARQHEALYERLLDERTADGRCLAGS